MLGKIKVTIIVSSSVWFFGLLVAAAIDGMGRMAPRHGDFSTTWAMYWAAITLASIVAGLIAFGEA